MVKFLYGCAAIGALLGVITIFSTFAASNSAPQEAAGFALACAFAVVPYVLARAVDMVRGEREALLRRVALAAEKAAAINGQ